MLPQQLQLLLLQPCVPGLPLERLSDLPLEELRVLLLLPATPRWEDRCGRRAERRVGAGVADGRGRGRCQTRGCVGEGGGRGAVQEGELPLNTARGVARLSVPRCGSHSPACLNVGSHCLT